MTDMKFVVAPASLFFGSVVDAIAAIDTVRRPAGPLAEVVAKRPLRRNSNNPLKPEKTTAIDKKLTERD